MVYTQRYEKTTARTSHFDAKFYGHWMIRRLRADEYNVYIIII